MSPEMTRSTRDPTRTSKAPWSSIPSVIPCHRGFGPASSTRAPRLDGDNRRHRISIVSTRSASKSAYDRASAARHSLSTMARSADLPSSPSMDVAVSASSGGSLTGRRLMPNPRTAYSTAAPTPEASARIPATLRRRWSARGACSPSTTTSFGHFTRTGNPVLARIPSATAAPPIKVRKAREETPRGRKRTDT